MPSGGHTWKEGIASVIGAVAFGALGAWWGFGGTVLGVAPGTGSPAATAPPSAVQAPPDATAPLPCVPVQPAGLRRPTSRTVDPELDPELVGRANPEPPADLPAGWSEAELRNVFSAPGDTLTCDEWPCLLEIRKPGGDPNLSGDAVTFEALFERLAAAGLDATVNGGTGQTGDEEVLLVSLSPKSIEVPPDVALRTSVRLFFAEEAARP